jgi:hypothetical protein
MKDRHHPQITQIAQMFEAKETDSLPERSVTTMRILDAIYTSAADGGRQVRFD